MLACVMNDSTDTRYRLQGEVAIVTVGMEKLGRRTYTVTIIHRGRMEQRWRKCHRGKGWLMKLG
jgi:hypothetical protein